MDPRFDRDKFLVNQKRPALNEKYYVFDEQGQPLFYVERPFKVFRSLRQRNITFYSDDSKTQRLLQINQDNFEGLKIDFSVWASEGKMLAVLTRHSFTATFQRRWTIRDLEQRVIAKVRENSLLLTVLRRFLPLKTDFEFLVPENDGRWRRVGTFNRRITIFDKYVLNMSLDKEQRLDRRVALAMGVLLGTGEYR